MSSSSTVAADDRAAVVDAADDRPAGVDAVVAGAAPARAARRPRTPLPVAAAGLLAVVEALALLAVGLTSLDGPLGPVLQTDGALVLVALLLLAGWVVLCAGGGANLVDGAGRLLLVGVAVGEIALLAALAVAGALGLDGGWPVVALPPGALPPPALALPALAVPVTKLLLARSVPATDWLAAGPRPRAARPALPPDHRRARAVTLGVIGLALAAFCLVSPAAGPSAAPAPVTGDGTR